MGEARVGGIPPPEVASRDQPPLSAWIRRAERARILAARHPASEEILLFYSDLAEWQGGVASLARTFENLPKGFPSLLDLVNRKAPAALGEAGRDLTIEDVTILLRDYWNSPAAAPDPARSRESFFAHAILQPYAAGLPGGFDCPYCSLPPLAGSLHQQGDGLAFNLICSLCLRPRPFSRTRCPACNETSEAQLSTFSAPDFPHLRVFACETCRSYLLVVDRSQDPAAIPEVDELAGLPLDLWALENGYTKLRTNIAGL